MSSLAALTESPVYSAAEADLALARGAALASARAVNTLDAPRAPLMSRTGALTSVLAAAVLIFVVSLSVALGLRLTPGSESTPERPRVANADAPAPSVPEAAPQSPRPATPPPPQAPAPEIIVARTLVVAVPPAPEVAPPPGPVNEPPAYAPPAPAFVPPAPPPAYVPPAPPPNYVPPAPQQPRLRDRILERIPIINRFHEPDYQYPYN
jgi:hypothetical protein